MKKSMLALQIISILGLSISFITLFSQTDSHKMLISLITFIGFGCIGMIPIFLNKKEEDNQEEEIN